MCFWPHREALVPHREAPVPNREALVPHRKALLPHKEALVFLRSLHQNCASQKILCLPIRWPDGNTFGHPATPYHTIPHIAKA